MTHQTFSPRPNVAIAYHRFIGGNIQLPGVMWLGGFRSDMTGQKATYLEEQCKQRGQSYVRFDYTGHGASSGDFINGCIGSWLHDALDVFDHLTTGPQILLGSSMGGWISLLLALRRQNRVAGVIGIAAAPDFAMDTFEKKFTEAQRATVERDGVIYIPSRYGDDPYPLTKKLFNDAKNYLLLDKEHHLQCPLHLIQGKQDDAVHWSKAEKIKSQFHTPDTRITYIDDGDHRLSRPEDLALIDAKIQALNKKHQSRE